MQFERPTGNSEHRFVKIRRKLIKVIRPNYMRARETNAAVDAFLERIESKFDRELRLHTVRLGLHLNLMMSYGILKVVVTEYAVEQFQLLLKNLRRLGSRLPMQTKWHLARAVTILLRQRFLNFFIFFFSRFSD